MQPAWINRVWPIAYLGHGVEYTEEFRELRCVCEQAVGEADDLFEPPDQERCYAHEAYDLADRRQPDELQVSPNHEDHQQRQCRRCAGQHRGDRPPGQHRHLRAKQRVHQPAQQRYFELDAGIALHQRDVTEGIGRGFGEIGIVLLDRSLHGVGLAHDQ